MYRLFIYSIFLSLISCEQLATKEYTTPSGGSLFMQMPIPQDNPMTEAGIKLGARLFHDATLSANNTISCSSCHLEIFGFSDDRPVSLGVYQRQGKRNAPSLLNVGYLSHGLFWDGRAKSLEEQSIHPIIDSVEMGNTVERLIETLNSHPIYKAQVKSAFGDTIITIEHVAKALAQFQRTLVTAPAKFDSVQLGLTQFTAAEKRGWIIFSDQPNDLGLPKAECLHCHPDPLFTEGKFENNGLDYIPDLKLAKDKGLGNTTGNLYDNAKFKVPSLRHIQHTAPYMHDGRFATLEEVIDHYNSGGKYAENRHPTIRQLNLSPQNKADLIAFLKTLD